MSLIPEGHPDFVETDTKIQDLPRCEPPNPYNYTKLQLAENAIWLAELKKLHPETPEYFLNLSIHAFRSWGEQETLQKMEEWDKAIS